jgi:hypothetical protein
MTSANLLVVLIVGTIVGALTGLAIGVGPSPLYLAFIAGIAATIVASIARHLILGPFGTRTPALVIAYGVVTSLAASALAMEVARLSALETSPVWIGTLAGLFSVILMAMLLITYHAEPGEQPMPLKR